MIAVILITGIIAAGLGLGFKDAADAARSVRERAELTDMANRAIERIAFDLRQSLPYSQRVLDSAPSVALEMLRFRSAGRFRRQSEGAFSTPVADVGAPTTGISSISPMYGFGVWDESSEINDLIVVHNAPASAASIPHNIYAFCEGAGCLHAAPNCATSSATDRCNGARITAIGSGSIGTNIGFASRHFAPTVTEANIWPRFFIVPNPTNAVAVTERPTIAYRCVRGSRDAIGNGTGYMDRYLGHPIALTQLDQPVAPLIARQLDYVEDCAITAYIGPAAVNMVAITVSLVRRNELITLTRQVWIPNT